LEPCAGVQVQEFEVVTAEQDRHRGEMLTVELGLMPPLATPLDRPARHLRSNRWCGRREIDRRTSRSFHNRHSLAAFPTTVRVRFAIISDAFGTAVLAPRRQVF